MSGVATSGETFTSAVWAFSSSGEMDLEVWVIGFSLYQAHKNYSFSGSLNYELCFGSACWVREMWSDSLPTRFDGRLSDLIRGSHAKHQMNHSSAASFRWTWLSCFTTIPDYFKICLISVEFRKHFFSKQLQNSHRFSFVPTEDEMTLRCFDLWG